MQYWCYLLYNLIYNVLGYVSVAWVHLTNVDICMFDYHYFIGEDNVYSVQSNFFFTFFFVLLLLFIVEQFNKPEKISQLACNH